MILTLPNHLTELIMSELLGYERVTVGNTRIYETETQQWIYILVEKGFRSRVSIVYCQKIILCLHKGKILWHMAY